MMPLASLRSRIFLALVVLTVFSIAAATYLVGARVNRDAEQTLRHDIVATSQLVEQLRSTRADTFATIARVFADAPKLKAAVATGDPPTVQEVAEDYQVQVHARLMLVTGRAGRVLASIGAPSEGLDPAVTAAAGEAIQGRESTTLLPAAEGVLQLVTVPIAIGVERPDILGALSVGFLLDDALASQLKAITGSDIAFGINGRVLASTLPEQGLETLFPLLRSAEPQTMSLGEDEYLAVAVPFRPGSHARDESVPTAIILRSRAEQRRFLREINNELAATAVIGILLATLLSFAVARTVTQPLGTITRVMREVATTGDLTRKIAFPGRRWWQDEDTQLVASTFNTLTESIARSQRDASQRERLSSLGRLSTVIAHEIRNPLMIIKAAVHGLRRPSVSADTLEEAVADIDGEVGRLNRIVNEVLDFARPIRFELGPADLNALCRESAAAAQASPGPTVELQLDPAAADVTTDGERLRLALVNLIANARQAVEARTTGRDDRPEPPATGATPLVTVRTRADRSRVSIVIADTGDGIDPADLPRIFDPYFTTKRGGTGLGLPIAKNIVDGLGGSLSVVSTSGRGTELHIDLPRAPERAVVHA